MKKLLSSSLAMTSTAGAEVNLGSGEKSVKDPEHEHSENQKSSELEEEAEQ